MITVFRRPVLLAATLSTSFTLANGAAAQNFGGSFDSGTGAASPPQTQTNPAPASDGFGGSFGPAGTTPQQPDPSQANPPVVGGSDFNGGSFEPVVVGPGTPGQTPPVQGSQPPSNGPSQTAPGQQQAAPSIQIDPQIFAIESRDFGVPPTDRLRNGQFHAATPTAIPGGQVVSTQALAQAMNDGMQLFLIDVLGGQYSIPNAHVVPALAQGGNYRDRTQQQATHWLGQVTGGNPDIPIVIFCSDPNCWLSYNASLRTIAAGYRSVYWYRGGIQAWQMAGLPMQPASF